uniref:N/A n=1 Tax=Ganoderma boninense TaxID=34458 RepID=A0A5K1JZR1_9APHY|nr:N/A [Ganoderma boninense]
MVYVVVPKYGRTNPTVYISICSLVGSVSVMAIKGLGVAVKLTFSGNNQFTRPATYVFGFLVATCIVVQTNYFNKALDTFSTNVVNPMYYVGFSTATIVASIILFQGLNTDDPANSLSLLAGFITTFLGVHLLELSRTPSPGPGDNGYVRAANGDEEVGMQTLYEPDQDDFEHVSNDTDHDRDHDHERSPLHRSARRSFERGRDRTS